MEGGAKWKQGRIHGYPSRVRVGRGHNLGQWNIWAGAIRPKKNIKAEKVECDRRTDQRTDEPTVRQSRVYCHVARD